MNFLGEILAGLRKQQPAKPFIFIAAMPRSGSTLLCGMLTKKPEMIILSEPAFQRGECRELGEYAEIPEFSLGRLKACEGNPQKMVLGFKENLLPQILKYYARVGVKECFLQGWREYLKIFPIVKFIILVRDPRDILLSTLDFGERVSWHREMWADQSTASIAERYLRTWEFQKEIMATQDYLTVRYEDLCSGKIGFKKIAEFCELSSKAPIDITTSILRAYPYRAWEIERHGKSLSSKSVFRWQKENSFKRLKRAKEFSGKFQDYSVYWGYEG